MKKYILGLFFSLFVGTVYADDLTTIYVQTWSYPGVPPSTIYQMGGTIFVGDTITDTNTGNRYVVMSFSFDPVNFVYSNVVYQQIITDGNLVANLPSNLQNTQLGISRDYSDLSSPAFSTAYQASTSNDAFIVARFSLSSTVLTAADLTAEVDTGSGYSQVGECAISGLVETKKCTLSFPVPIGAHYRFIQVSGTSSIIGVKKLDL